MDAFVTLLSILFVICSATFLLAMPLLLVEILARIRLHGRLATQGVRGKRRRLDGAPPIEDWSRLPEMFLTSAGHYRCLDPTRVIFRSRHDAGSFRQSLPAVGHIDLSGTEITVRTVWPIGGIVLVAAWGLGWLTGGIALAMQEDEWVIAPVAVGIFMLAMVFLRWSAARTQERLKRTATELCQIIRQLPELDL